MMRNYTTVIHMRNVSKLYPLKLEEIPGGLCVFAYILMYGVVFIKSYGTINSYLSSVYYVCLGFNLHIIIKTPSDIIINMYAYTYIQF